MDDAFRKVMGAGEDFFLLFRLYGPGEALFDGSWTLGDVEKVN
jgi:hypothetical protein